MLATESQTTYVCPECHGCADRLVASDEGMLRGTAPAPDVQHCPLCHGRGRVTVQQMVDYYVIEAD